MNSLLIVLIFLLLIWLEGRKLWQRRLYRDLAVVVVIYLVALVPAVLLSRNPDLVPPVNTAIRLLIARLLGQ